MLKAVMIPMLAILLFACADDDGGFTGSGPLESSRTVDLGAIGWIIVEDRGCGATPSDSEFIERLTNAVGVARGQRAGDPFLINGWWWISQPSKGNHGLYGGPGVVYLPCAGYDIKHEAGHQWVGERLGIAPRFNEWCFERAWHRGDLSPWTDMDCYPHR